MHKIKNRYTGNLIATGETARAAAEAHKTDLRGADLGGANLRGAYLRGADLGGAYLGGADLGEADLGEADLRGADLGGADLTGARLSWQSHDIIADILLREAGDDIAKRKIAGLVLLSRDWCWQEFASLDDPLLDWAMEVLKARVVEGDDAPEELTGYVVTNN